MRFIISMMCTLVASLLVMPFIDFDIVNIFSRQMVVLIIITITLVYLLWIPAERYFSPKSMGGSITVALLSGVAGFLALAYLLLSVLSGSLLLPGDFIEGLSVPLASIAFLALQWMLIGLSWHVYSIER